VYPNVNMVLKEEKSEIKKEMKEHKLKDEKAVGI
jgi:hypothetical protein